MERLGEYLTKGFTLDDARLRAPPGPGVPDYFDELLERIRDIRASERRMYLRVREIFALAADYTPDDSTTSKVFQVIQNKLHFAATGHTAPELIAARAQADAPNMGLTSWRGAQVLKSVVVNVCDAPDLSAALRLCARQTTPRPPPPARRADRRHTRTGRAEPQSRRALTSSAIVGDSRPGTPSSASRRASATPQTSLRLCAFARHSPRRASPPTPLSPIRAPASPHPNFFRLPLLHPLTA